MLSSPMAARWYENGSIPRRWATGFPGEGEAGFGKRLPERADPLRPYTVKLKHIGRPVLRQMVEPGNADRIQRQSGGGRESSRKVPLPFTRHQEHPL